MDTRRLRRFRFFRTLAPERLRRLVEASRVVRVEKGAALFHQGAPAQDAWIVLEGWVHLVRNPASHGAKPVVLYTVTPADVLCGISVIEPSVYTATGLAGTRTTVLRIPRAAFDAALRGEPLFAYEALRLCAQRVHHMAEQHGVMAEPVPRRIIRAILRLQRQFGPTLPITHRELAQMSWTTTESAIRAVRKLKQRGLVRGRRGELRVTQGPALAQLLDGGPGPARSMRRVIDAGAAVV